MEPKVEFAKVRDFGEIISDSFLFVRENFKSLISAFFTFCGIFLLAAAVLGILNQFKMADVYRDPQMASNAVAKIFSVEYFLALLFSMLSITAIMVTTLTYITLYREKGNIAPTNEEIWGYFKYYYLKIFGSTLINIVIAFIGFIFCVIPGIYLYPILGLIFPIMMVENTSYGYAFSKSFKLIKNNWWLVFGSLFIMGLIVSIAMGIAVAPFSVTSFIDTLVNPQKGLQISKPMAVAAVIVGQICHALYVLPFVTLALCYFSVSEGKEGAGLLNRINQLGNNDADNNLPAEEY
ncbi:hypothetical protein GCM10027049_06420 [Mucilaginibacter puniceus]